MFFINFVFKVNQWDGIQSIECDVDASLIPQNGTAICFRTGEQVIKYLKVDKVGLHLGIFLKFI